MKNYLGLLFGSIASLHGVTAAICVGLPAAASSIQSLTTGEASGEDNTPQIMIPRGHSVNLSFIASGEIIRQARIDDRSRILVRFDAPLCGGASQGNCSNSAGASVITLSQLATPLKFAPNEKNAYSQEGSYRTTLTVVTTRGRQRALYTFELVTLNSSTTSIRTVQIVRGNRNVSNLPRAAGVSSAQRQSTPTIDEVVNQIQNGIQIAGQRKLISNPSQTWTNLQKFSAALAARQVSVEQAAAQNNVPLGIVDWLKTLHN